MKSKKNGGHRGKTITGLFAGVYMSYEEHTNTRYSKAYLDDVQQREVIAELGDSASMLLNHLLRIAARKQWSEIKDEECARHFGWNTRKAQKLRLALEKAGYLSSRRFYANGGKKMIVYYIGKEAVEAEERAEP